MTLRKVEKFKISTHHKVDDDDENEKRKKIS